jgi:hypothetical protein
MIYRPHKWRSKEEKHCQARFRASIYTITNYTCRQGTNQHIRKWSSGLTCQPRRSFEDSNRGLPAGSATVLLEARGLKALVSVDYHHERGQWGRITLLSGKPASLRHGDCAQMGEMPRQRVSSGRQLLSASSGTLTIFYLLGHRHVLQCKFDNGFSPKKTIVSFQHKFKKKMVSLRAKTMTSLQWKKRYLSSANKRSKGFSPTWIQVHLWVNGCEHSRSTNFFTHRDTLHHC